MTQTKIKGLCAWHPDVGYRWQTFDDACTTKTYIFWKLFHYMYDGSDFVPMVREFDELKAEGWEVRECYLTIEDV